MDLRSNEKCKKFTSACLNRELKSHQMNSVQDRLLKTSNNKVEKSLRKEWKNQSHQHEGLKREQTSIMKRTPSVSDWMKQNQRHLDAWKERERQTLERRHKYSIRQYKVPLEKVPDPDESETDGYLGPSRPGTGSTVRRAHSMIERPKTSSSRDIASRRKSTFTEHARVPLNYRRHSTAAPRIRDFSSLDDDVF